MLDTPSRLTGRREERKKEGRKKEEAEEEEGEQGNRELEGCLWGFLEEVFVPQW